MRQLCAALVYRHARQPSRELLKFLQFIQVTVHAHQALLERLVGVVVVADDGHYKPVQRTLNPVAQRLECALVTRAALLKQLSWHLERLHKIVWFWRVKFTKLKTSTTRARFGVRLAWQAFTCKAPKAAALCPGPHWLSSTKNF